MSKKKNTETKVTGQRGRKPGSQIIKMGGPVSVVEKDGDNVIIKTVGKIQSKNVSADGTVYVLDNGTQLTVEDLAQYQTTKNAVLKAVEAIL